MSLLDNEFVRRDAIGNLQWRAEPLRLGWAFGQIVSADGHVLQCRFNCSARPANSPADRQIFAETFLNGSESANVSQIREHLASMLRQAVEKLASVHPAMHALEESQRAAWVQSLREALDAAAFACGVELLSPFVLDLQSSSLRQHQLRQASSTRQSEQLQHATGLLQQFQTMRQSAPELSAGQLLQRLSPAERGSTLQSLLAASSGESNNSQLWAVAGPSLMQIDPRSTTPQFTIHSLPTDLGPLRSVQQGTIGTKSVLLIGAQRGVMIVPPQNPLEARLFAHPEFVSQLGFNRIVCDEQNRLWASHGDAGVVGWKIDQPDAPFTVFAERGARNLQILDRSRLIYTAEDQIILRDGDERQVVASSSNSPIIAIIPIATGMVVIRQQGEIEILDRASGQIIETRHRGATICAAAALPWLDEIRLLLATEAGPIDCVGLDDAAVLQFASAHRALKRVAATSDVIAGVSGDRQRIILWRSWDGQRPIGEIHVTSQTKHRIADLQFA